MTSLEASIAHWVQNLTADPGDVRLYSDSCPLCTEFQQAGAGDANAQDDQDADQKLCGECPVAKATHKDLCRDTPWSAARDAFARWNTAAHFVAKAKKHMRAQPMQADLSGFLAHEAEENNARAEWRRQAWREIEFLSGLRTS